MMTTRKVVAMQAIDLKRVAGGGRSLVKREKISRALRIKFTKLRIFFEKEQIWFIQK